MEYIDVKEFLGGIKLANDAFLDNIPAIMHSMNWLNAEKLFKRWMNSPAAKAPNYTRPSIGEIKMEWVLGFSRAGKAVKNSLSNKEYDTVKTRWGLLDRLGLSGIPKPGASVQGYNPSNPYVKPGSKRFGDLSDGQQAGATRVGDSISVGTLSLRKAFFTDDLDGTLGAFGISMALSGTVNTPSPSTDPLSLPKPPNFDIEIDTVGYYVKDLFEFEEKGQDLGWWTIYPNGTGTASATPSSSVVPSESTEVVYDGSDCQHVTNDDFQRYRKNRNKGGDFIVYTDVAKYKISPTIKFNTLDILSGPRPNFDD